MKIAFIIGRWPSNSHTAVLNQVIELNNLGLEAKTFFSFNIDEKKSKELPKGLLDYNLNKSVIYIKQPNFSRYKNKLANKFYIFLTVIPYLFKTFFYSPKILFKSLFKKEYGEHKKSFKIIYAIQNLLNKKLEFDIIHCQYTPWGIWGAIFIDLGLISGKLVTSFRGYGINDIPKSKPHDFYYFLIKKCNVFTSNTEYTKKNAIKLGFPEDKIQIIHTSLHLNKYVIKNRKYNKDETFNILTAASLKEVKGLKYSIKAIKIVIDKFPDIKIKYKIAGTGELKDTLRNLIKSNNLEQNVELLGFVNHDELIKIYDKAHLFILPSVTTSNGNREGQGLVVQEAQACGIPVIGTNSGGIPEGFINNKTGFIVEEKKSNEIAEKIVVFINNPEYITKFGEAGRRFVEENFNIKRETKKLVELYKQK